MRTADLPVGRSLFPVQGVFPGQSAPHLSRTARLRRNCASSAAFRSRAAESVSCTVCRMCGGVCEYVRHAAEFMKFRCPAYARRRICSARGAYRAGRGCFRNLQIEFRCFNNVNQNRNEKNTYFRSIAAVYRLFPRQMMESKPPRRSRICRRAVFPLLEHLRSFAPVPVHAFLCLVPSVSVFLRPRSYISVSTKFAVFAHSASENQ